MSDSRQWCSVGIRVTLRAAVSRAAENSGLSQRAWMTRALEAALVAAGEAVPDRRQRLERGRRASRGTVRVQTIDQFLGEK